MMELVVHELTVIRAWARRGAVAAPRQRGEEALVREGVPAQAISVVGRGEQGLLVQTGDGVRGPQNRRVEIDIQ